MRMNYDDVKRVKVDQCKWVSKNLEHYKFLTEDSQLLKEKIAGFDYTSQRPDDINEIKRTYIDFVNNFYNNPYGYFVDQYIEKGKYSITADDYNYYLLRNNFNVYIPIGYAKDMRADTEEVPAYNGEMNSTVAEYTDYMQGRIDTIEEDYPVFTYDSNKKLKVGKIIFSVLVILISIADFIAAKQVFEHCSGIFTAAQNLVIIMLMVIPAIILLRAVSDIIYCSRLYKSVGILDKGKQYVEDFGKMVRDDIAALERRLKDFVNSDDESLRIVPKTYDLMKDKFDWVEKFGKKTKNRGKGVGKFAFILIILIAIPFVNIYRSPDRMWYMMSGRFDVFVKSALCMEVDPLDYIHTYMPRVGVTAASAAYLNPEGAASLGSDIRSFTSGLTNLYDGDTDTAWEVDSYPMVITFRLEPSDGIRFIKIYNGRCEEEDYYYAYRKPKSAVLNFSDGTVIPIEFPDSYDDAEYRIDLWDEPIVADLVTMTIKEYYTDDTATDDMYISEVEFFE